MSDYFEVGDGMNLCLQAARESIHLCKQWAGWILSHLGHCFEWDPPGSSPISRPGLQELRTVKQIK